MHLRQGSRRDGLLIEINDFSATGAQLLLKNRLSTVKGKGGNPVLQGRQFGDPTRWQDIRPSRQQLAELDECRSKLKQLLRQPPCTQLLAGFATLRSRTARIAKSSGIPPQKQQQGQNSTPNTQSPKCSTQQGLQATEQDHDRSSRRIPSSATRARS